jgi:dextranase
MDLFPEKSFFLPKEKPSFVLRGIPEGTPYLLFALEKVVLKGNVHGDELVLPKLKNGTYGLEVGSLTTGFEVGEDPFLRPRYGFLSDFSFGASASSYGEFFLKMHLNCAQYYDWMYRHEDYLAPCDPFNDPMGKEKSQKTVKAKLDYGKRLGIQPFAYGAIYGATNVYAAAHPEERFYDFLGKPLTFIDRFSIMNFTQGSAWRERLLSNYEKAIDFGFSGIHMDTYGSPKEAWNVRGERVSFERVFPSLIDEASKRLKKKGGVVTFNNVGAWPLEVTCSCPSAFDYAEIWDPLTDYDDLLSLVRAHHIVAKRKPFVLAAYLHPFYGSEAKKALASAELLDALISASGAFHLIYGEEGRVLRTGYYPDNALLGESAVTALRKIADFSVRYGALLYDTELTDISLSHLAGPNAEVIFSNPKVFPKALPGRILSLAREKESLRIFSFINFEGQQDAAWNAEKSTPIPSQIGTVSFARRYPDERFFWAEVDSPRLEPIPFEEKAGRIIIALPKIRLWGILVSKREESI